MQEHGAGTKPGVFEDGPARGPLKRAKRMKLSIFTITVVVLLLSSCAQFATDHNTDLAIDTYAPSERALGVAENHAKEYWAKHQEQIGRGTRYLAVQSDSIFSDEIPDLYAKLINSPAVNASDLEDFGNDSELNMYCVNIFDTQTERLVSQEGYAVIDLPGPGRVARFGPYTARYIGTGA
jgi:hypothetical protein